MRRLSSHAFQDPARASREIGELSRGLPDTVVERIDLLLAVSPASEQGLRYFTRLRERQPASFDRLVRSPIGLRYLIAIFTHSHFLSEEILEHPAWIEELLASGDLHGVLEARDYRNRLDDTLVSPGVPSALELAQFRRRQILRIVVRDVLELGSLAEITSELSALADAILETAYQRIHADLLRRYGDPNAKFCVIALGKLGGGELNYSSDIDLMFLYSGNGQTTGPSPVTYKEFFKEAANQLTTLLSTYTAEGLCYRVDLRLRPDGRLGEVCISLDGARQYYANRGRDWELQMLIKARIAAGDRAVGRKLLDFVEPRIYSTTLDFSAVEALSATRERLNEQLAAKKSRRRPQVKFRRRSIDVKLERGGIRDIEFVVQCLQRLHGGSEPWVRHGGTLLALSRLHDKDFLSETEYGRLASAYQFLRDVEHRLQLVDDLQTHTLPEDPAELELLARRMPGPEQERSAASFLDQMQNHFKHVIEVYERVVHSSKPSGSVTSNVVRALDQRSPALAAALTASGLKRGYRDFEHFLERAGADVLGADQPRTRCTLDLFEHSPFFAEELIRTPALVEEIGGEPGEEPAPADATELRRWYRRQMLRIQSKSVCRSHPIFDTLAETSELADAAIARAYQIAIADVRAAHPPLDGAYPPASQMFVIALGRLGMREFDLASDADLVFVLAESDAAEIRFWTRVAERIIDLLTAYTGEGVLFAVDTRLRPNGSGGPLVHTETAVRDYFGRAAEAWEGITYMKSRVVAGDAAGAESFLHQLQEVDWRRYGQGGRSRADLQQMRTRLEREQGASHPLKAGRGGYYDIDFMLMYLRLKSAGIFFKVLNTPERIVVLESMGHLDRAEAQFLDQAATFYRALDHALRILTGHAEGKLPTSEAVLETLGNLVKRWTPVPLDQLSEIRARTRALFDRLFG
jgi:glutamate-ammonia-ligase adenylyltransferase